MKANAPPRPPGFDRLTALVFDFDGTLAHLVIDFDRMRNSILKLAEEYIGDCSAYQGGLILETMAAVRGVLEENDGARSAEFYARATAAVEEIELEAAEGGRLFSQTRPALDALARAGYKNAVITRNFGRAVRRVFPDIEDYCPVFIPRDLAVRVKPDPAHLQTALQALDAAGPQTLMVGDHPLDIETGRACRARTAGAATGRVSAEELAAAGADVVVNGLDELVELLTGRRP
jgi:phosphoglycolate phosphatase